MSVLVQVDHFMKSVTTAGTAVQLSTTSKLALSIQVQALPGNTNNIYVGKSSVSSSDYAASLGPGDSFWLEVPNVTALGTLELDLSDLYIDADTNGEGVAVTYIKRA